MITDTRKGMIIMRIAIATLALAAAAIGATTTGSQAGGADALHDHCRFEDGSGQRVCIWDAGHQGNGEGDSFIAIRGGTDRARYVMISHAKAHRLTH
jgi:hypothetical protein